MSRLIAFPPKPWSPNLDPDHNHDSDRYKNDFDHDINDDRVLIVLYQVTLAEEVMAKNATISPDREQVTKMITMMITMMMMMMITKMIL